MEFFVYFSSNDYFLSFSPAARWLILSELLISSSPVAFILLTTKNKEVLSANNLELTEVDPVWNLKELPC